MVADAGVTQVKLFGQRADTQGWVLLKACQQIASDIFRGADVCRLFSWCFPGVFLPFPSCLLVVERGEAGLRFEKGR